MTIRILEGHILDVLARELAGSIHCAITSPPYLWLRAYGTEPQVWGAAEGCEHQWGEEGRGGSRIRNEIGGDKKAGAVVLNPPTGAFCARCGAWRGELGQEPSPELYVQHLVAVMEAVKRVLRDDGTLWVNLAGCYFNDPGGQNGGVQRNGTGASTLTGSNLKHKALHAISAKAIEANTQLGRKQRGRHPWLKALDWVDVPGLFAHAMQAAGWIWRSDVTWVKPSALPESVSGTRWERCRARLKGQTTAEGTKYGEGFGYRAGNFRDETPENAASRAEWADCPGCPRCATTQGYVLRRGNGRPTKSTERVLLFIKRSGAYFDSEAVREPTPDMGYTVKATKAGPLAGSHGTAGEDGNGMRMGAAYNNPAGRNLRDWWVLSPEPFSDAHYAAYPTTLPTRCIRAGTSERGCCPGCGAPWARVVGETQAWAQQAGLSATLATVRDDKGEDWVGGRGNRAFSNTSGVTAERETLGWRPTCRCPGAADLIPAPCRVLDPFCGSGSTLIAADRLGRHAVGVELKPSYVQMAQRRITQDAPLLMWGAVTVEGAQGEAAEAPSESDLTKQERHPNRTVAGFNQRWKANHSQPSQEAIPLLLEPLEEPEDAVAGG